MPKKSTRPPNYVYPSKMPGLVHPCKAAGMTKVDFWIWPDRKRKLAQYCRMKSITMTDLFHTLVAAELEKNFDAVHGRYKRQRIRERGRAYRFILNHNKRKL